MDRPRTVVTIRQTANGWARERNSTAGAAKVATQRSQRQQPASEQVEEAHKAPLRREGQAGASVRAAGVGRGRGGGGGLVALAKRRSVSGELGFDGAGQEDWWAEEEEHDLEDEESQDEVPDASAILAAEAAAKAERKAAKRKAREADLWPDGGIGGWASSDWWGLDVDGAADWWGAAAEEEDEEARFERKAKRRRAKVEAAEAAVVAAREAAAAGRERAQRKSQAKVSIDLSRSYSGVVKKRDVFNGNLFIDCEPVTQACKRPAVITPDNNLMGARVGSIVCFKLTLDDVDGKPLAKDIVISGFDDEIDGAEVSDSSSEEEPKGKGKGKTLGKGMGKLSEGKGKLSDKGKSSFGKGASKSKPVVGKGLGKFAAKQGNGKPASKNTAR